MIKRAAILACAALLLAGCVAGPRATGSLDRKSLSWAQAVIDPRVAADVPAFERSELLRVLGPLGRGGRGMIRVLPSFSFRPATIAVVADEASPGDTANQSASKAKNWLGSKRWTARYELSLIDAKGKRVSTNSVSLVTGKKGQEAARRACFAKLISDIRLLAQNREPIRATTG